MGRSIKHGAKELKRVSATRARVGFGELMERVDKTGDPVVVERGGTPKVVVMPFRLYESLKAPIVRAARHDALSRALAVGQTIAQRRGGGPLMAPEEVIRAAREDRDGEFLPLR